MAEAKPSGSVENILSPNENLVEEPSSQETTEQPMVREEVVRRSTALKKRKYHVKILVMGLTGAGKSSLINAMMGDIVANVQPGPMSCQTDIECHKGEHDGIKIKIYDTAGFGDSIIPEKKIIKNISEGTPRKGFDLIIIAIKMTERLATNATQMLSSLGKLLDEQMWKRTIVVLTFANMLVTQLEEGYQDYSEDGLKEEFDRHTRQFKTLFSDHTKIDKEIAQNIPFILVGGFKSRELPTDKDWLVTLWDHSIIRCRTEVKPFLRRLRIQRLINDLRLKVHSIFIKTNNEEAIKEKEQEPNSQPNSAGEEEGRIKPDSNQPNPKEEEQDPDSNQPNAEEEEQDPDSNQPNTEEEGRIDPDSNQPNAEEEEQDPDSNQPNAEEEGRIDPDSNQPNAEEEEQDPDSLEPNAEYNHQPRNSFGGLGDSLFSEMLAEFPGLKQD